LRLADALDNEHGGKVSSFSIAYDRPRVLLKLQGQGDLLLEKWALVKRFSLFEEVFGTRMAIVD
jgi:exopolyphosphatase/guanosine-5'-triphosphate,3'-diphosphate pyrophosphatase